MAETEARATRKASDGQSISRAMAVLNVVADCPGASLGQIAKATGLPRSTVQRLVGALHAEGLLTKTFGEQGVYLGMELARLGGKVSLDARALLLPLMKDLHARIGENIDLTVIEDGRVVVIEQIASNANVRVISYVGRQHPVHCTANGKAHLSQLSRDQALELLSSDLERYTPNSITDPGRLMDQIGTYRQDGLYFDREEYAEDIFAVATPLPEIGGRKFAVSVSMPGVRFRRDERNASAALIEFRRAVDEVLGLRR